MPDATGAPGAASQMVQAEAYSPPEGAPAG